MDLLCQQPVRVRLPRGRRRKRGCGFPREACPLSQTCAQATLGRVRSCSGREERGTPESESGIIGPRSGSAPVRLGKCLCLAGPLFLQLRNGRQVSLGGGGRDCGVGKRSGREGMLRPDRPALGRDILPLSLEIQSLLSLGFLI